MLEGKRTLKISGKSVAKKIGLVKGILSLIRLRGLRFTFSFRWIN